MNNVNDYYEIFEPKVGVGDNSRAHNSWKEERREKRKNDTFLWVVSKLTGIWNFYVQNIRVNSKTSRNRVIRGNKEKF